MTKEQALSYVERTLNHPVAMRIVNYLFERGAITARNKVTISEIERDLGINRGNIYRLIVGGKRHRSYLRGFVHYPDKGLREGFYLLPAGILTAIGASKEEIAEVLIRRKENSINAYRQIVQAYHLINFHKLPPKVREVLKRDKLNENIAVSRLKRLLKSKTAIKVLKTLRDLGATSWKSAVPITEISKASGLNKGAIYKLTTRVYPRAKKSHTKFRPPVLHGVVHYSKPNTKEGKYYIYPKWVSFVEWLVNATEKDIEQLLNSEEDLKRLAPLFLTSQNSSFPQVNTKVADAPPDNREVSTELTIPYSFNSSYYSKENNLPASSGSQAATARQDHKEDNDCKERIPQLNELSYLLEEEVTLSKHDTLSTNNDIRFSRGGVREWTEPLQLSDFGREVDDSLSEVDRSTTDGKGTNRVRKMGEGDRLPTAPATMGPATAAPATNTAPPQLSGFNFSIEVRQDRSESGGGRRRRRLHYCYVRDDNGEIICKLPYRPRPSQEELARVWREWFVPNVRARILSFEKLYAEGRCARCLGFVGRDKLGQFYVSWARRLWRVVKRYGLDSAALQLLAFNKTYVCRECFRMLFIIMSWIALELRYSLRKHVGYDVFEPVCMRCGSRCPDCTDREVRWAYVWNREIALNKLRNFLTDFETFLSNFEPAKSVEEAKRQLLKVEALIRKNFDGADYWSWADWHDYPLGEDEDDWEEESEFTTSSDSPCCEEEDELN
jgi:hypothetical protein